MAESMRGMRLGTQSLESDRGVSLASRQTAEFRCKNAHEFPVVFSLEAELPQTWDCTDCNAVAVRIENGVEIEVTGLLVDEKRTHFDMVLERRTRDELEELLAEVLAEMRERRSKGRLTA
jgi:RNA polymerase-binding protein